MCDIGPCVCACARVFACVALCIPDMHWFMLGEVVLPYCQIKQLNYLYSSIDIQNSILSFPQCIWP